ncbi:MAG: M50 family metallopeptidase [Terracidiphilus sp.]
MIVGINWYLRWGHSHGLPITNGYLSLIQIVPAILIVTTLHEAGHAAVGRALGMKSRAFVVGPFQWRICDGQWRFQFLPVKFFSGGLTSQVPANSEFSRWKETWMIAGGPLASLLAGVVALSLTLTAAGKSYERFWEFFGLVATVSLGGFALNLIPGRSGVNYTDGAQIYQLLRGGSWAALHHLMNVADSMQVTTLRPKDFDIHAIQRLCLSFERGRQGFQLRLLASSYFLDSGMISQACDAVAEAERIYNESPWDTSAELCMAFVYRTAFLRHDATAARRWWDRMEAKKPTHFGVDYWLAKSALSWIEGHAGEAREAWEKGNLMAQKLPAAGDYEFDRYRCSLLRDCIEKMEPSLAS